MTHHAPKVASPGPNPVRYALHAVEYSRSCGQQVEEVALQQREAGPCVSCSRVHPRPSLAVSHTWGAGVGRWTEQVCGML